MVQQQIGSQVGGGSLADPNMIGEGDYGESAISEALFAVTKDLDTITKTIKAINPLLNNYYTDAKLNGLTKNDLIFVLTKNAEAVEGAVEPVDAWAVKTDYLKGQRVTVVGGSLQAMNAGTSDDTSAPTLPGDVGSTVVDNTITWIRIS